MIYSLKTLLQLPESKVLHNNEPVSYSWGDIDALNKWLVSMNNKQIDSAMGMPKSKKYPLIWLAEGWKAKESNPGIKFSNVDFYISKNSKIETLNEKRIENFNIIYEVANDFIKELKNISRIEENNISYFEKPSFNTVSNSKDKKTYTSDIWDTLIISLDLTIINLSSCFK